MTAHGTVPLTAPDGGWTTDDLDAMPDDGVRRELHDGVLVASHRVWNAAELAGMPRDGVRRDLIDGVLWVFPRASAGHRLAVGRVAAVLAGHPDGGRSRRSAGLRLDADTVTFPDLHIAPAGSGHEPPPLVVEIATPFNRGLCSTLYPALYAAAGIRRFWRVDLEPRFAVVAHELDVESKRYMSAPPPVFR